MAGLPPEDVTPVDVPFHPNVPKRQSVMLAFLGVLLAGSLGGTIGWGLVDASCTEAPMQVQRLLESVRGYHVHTRSCGLYLMLGALTGAIVCALGAAIVAVLVLRAQSEWRSHPPPPGHSQVRR
ncbi:MAG: hypothetical protein QOI55_915 [Actinomycetota bacterium]|jgi:hypothetical protein|nr:hypothetical protein [Actinomycetota bacterium]